VVVVAVLERLDKTHHLVRLLEQGEMALLLLSQDLPLLMLAVVVVVHGVELAVLVEQAAAVLGEEMEQ
jgi:hypothetical protein